MSKETHNTVLTTLVGIVAVALLSGVGWIIVKMFDMSSTLNVTAQRVDRIVGVLPDLRVKIATEDLARKIGLAVVTKPPIEISPGRWVRPVIFMDYSRGKRQEFQIPAQSFDDPSGTYMVGGLTNGIAIEKITFDEFSAASAELGRPKPYPPWVDPQGSCAILKPRLDYARKISAQFGKPVKETSIARGPIIWQKLVDGLAQIQFDSDPEASSTPDP